MNAVLISHLYKSYEKGKVVAVHDVSFTVEEGSLFGLIGPDGSGKTSLFRMLATLLLPDSGSATVNNFDILKDYREIRKSIGYMPGRFSLYQDLTVKENLDFFATVFGTSVKENYDLIRDIYIQIEPFSSRRAGKLSGGMKQKLALCCALIHRPALLLLDEPTTGVDAVSRGEFWDMLKNLRREGISVLVATPYMDEATLCDRIALMQKGSILSVDSPQGIIQAYPGKLYSAASRNMYALLKMLRDHDNVTSCFAFGDSIHFKLKSNNLEQLRLFLSKQNATDVILKEITPGIEDCFIEQMK
jgi:ABC-2 type transport system ATP-binding protein